MSSNSSDMSDKEEEVNKRRLTQILHQQNLHYYDDEQSESSFEDSADLTTDLNVEGTDIISKVQVMTEMQVEECMKKLKINEEDSDKEDTLSKGNVNKVKEETNPKQDEKQKKKVQKPQVKKTVKVPTTETSEDVANIIENKNNKVKKNNLKSSNMDSQQSEDDLNKKEGDLSENNQIEENINNKSKPKDTSDTKEKKTAKSNNNKKVIDKKEKQIKSLKKIGDDNSTKEHENDNSKEVEIHMEGRVMRPRKAKEVLKEINEPAKKPNTKSVTAKAKRNEKKLEIDKKKTDEIPDSTSQNEELTTGQKKKIEKKLAQEVNKLKESSISTATNVKSATGKFKKSGKKDAKEIEELQEDIASAITKAGVETDQLLKDDKDLPADLQEVDKKVLNSNKNVKVKKHPKNAKTTTDDAVEPTVAKIKSVEPVNTVKTKLKSKPEIVQNESLLLINQNKLNENTIPSKRTNKKK